MVSQRNLLGAMLDYAKRNRPEAVPEMEKRITELDLNQGPRISGQGFIRIEPDDLFSLRPASEWREEDGAVLWWHLPVQEPPEVGYGPGAGECRAGGTPTECALALASGWLTHWSRIPDPRKMVATDGEAVGR